MLRCPLCHHPLGYVHGHGACLTGGCPLFGVNQAECCDGETAASCPAPTSALRPGPPPSAPHGEGPQRLW